MENEKSLGDAFLDSMHQIKKSLFNLMNKQKIDGLRQSEFFMLILIARCVKEKEMTEEKATPGIRISVLSKESNSSMPGVSQVINVLENQGYVQRITTKEDRRVVYVQLTEAGKTLLETAPSPFVNLLTNTAKEMGEEKTQQLIGLMNEFSETIMRLNAQSDRKDQKEGNKQ